MNKLYTTESLADLLAVSPRTIRRERREGRLPYVKVRGQIRYRESDVRGYLDRNAVEPAGEQRRETPRLRSS